MTTGIVASLVAVLVWAFVEGFARFYPARETWLRIRRMRGREAVRRMRERFEAAFWCADISTYALALDGAKQPCRVRSSNAGQALLSGIASPRHAARTGSGMGASVSSRVRMRSRPSVR